MSQVLLLTCRKVTSEAPATVITRLIPIHIKAGWYKQLFLAQSSKSLWVKVINLSRSLKFNYHSFKIHPLPLKKGSSIHGLKNLTWMIVVKCTKYMYCAIHHFFSLLDCWLLRDPYWSKTWCKIKLIVLSNFNYKSAALEPYALSRGYSF